MARTGGDIVEISYNHPTIGSGVLYPKSGEEFNYDIGGIRTDDEAQGVTGDGRTLNKKTRSRWMIEGPVGWDMNVEDELQKLTDMAGDPLEADWTTTHVNGDVRRATGSPVGDVVGNAGSATIALKVAGGGVLEKI